MTPLIRITVRSNILQVLEPARQAIEWALIKRLDMTRLERAWGWSPPLIEALEHELCITAEVVRVAVQPPLFEKLLSVAPHRSPEEIVALIGEECAQLTQEERDRVRKRVLGQLGEDERARLLPAPVEASRGSEGEERAQGYL